MKTPADAGRGQGLRSENHFPATSDRISTTPAIHLQYDIAARRLARRFGLQPATASAIAAANCWGQPC